MKYTVQEIFNLIGEDNMSFDVLEKHSKKSKQIELEGFPVYAKSLRYATFFQKGCKCVKCGKEGTYFQLDASKEGNKNRRHLNLYCEDGTLMTKDHIKPKSKGGLDCVSNMQPMCEICNKEKGNAYSGEWTAEQKAPREYVVCTNQQNGKEELFDSIDTAIYSLLQRQHNGIDIKKLGSKVAIKMIIRSTLKAAETLANNQTYMGYRWSTEIR